MVGFFLSPGPTKTMTNMTGSSVTRLFHIWLETLVCLCSVLEIDIGRKVHRFSHHIFPHCSLVGGQRGINSVLPLLARVAKSAVDPVAIIREVTLPRVELLIPFVVIFIEFLTLFVVQVQLRLNERIIKGPVSSVLPVHLVVPMSSRLVS